MKEERNTMAMTGNWQALMAPLPAEATGQEEEEEEEEVGAEVEEEEDYHNVSRVLERRYG
jgi:hypothetical protein